MAGAWVQSFTFEGNDQLTSKTLAVNTDGPATANNLLVAVIVVQAGGDSFTTPTGYTLLNDYSSGAGENWGVASYYRVASGSAADDCAFAWTDAGRPQIVIQEFSGLDSSSPFEQKAEDESNVLTSVTSQGTGTATPDTANGIAVACFACEDESVWSAASTSVGGSFSNLATAGYVARSTTGMASLPYTSTAGQSATFSTSESGYVAYGSIAVFKESAAGGATVTPGAGSLALAGYAPTVVVTNNIVVNVPAGSLALTSYAPTVITAITVAPAVGTLTLSGLTPTLVQTANHIRAPPAGSLALTGYAPSISVGVAVSVAPAAGALALTGYAPTLSITANFVIEPATGTLALAGYAPTLALTANHVTQPGAGALALTGYAPATVRTETVTPGAGSLALTGYAPTVELSTGVAPGTGSLALTGYAPTLSLTTNNVVQPGVGSLSITGYVPGIIAVVIPNVQKTYYVRPIKEVYFVKPIKTTYRVD